jgi:hypothetical protein
LLLKERKNISFDFGFCLYLLEEEISALLLEMTRLLVLPPQMNREGVTDSQPIISPFKSFSKPEGLPENHFSPSFHIQPTPKATAVLIQLSIATLFSSD